MYYTRTQSQTAVCACGHIVVQRQTDDVHYQAELSGARRNSCSQIALIYHCSNEAVIARPNQSISEPLNQLNH